MGALERKISSSPRLGVESRKKSLFLLFFLENFAVLARHDSLRNRRQLPLSARKSSSYLYSAEQSFSIREKGIEIGRFDGPDPRKVARKFARRRE